jgi:hypothetical protein
MKNSADSAVARAPQQAMDSVSLADAPANLVGLIEPGERLIWQGRPSIGKFRAHYARKLFGLTFYTLAGLWIVLAGKTREQLFQLASSAFPLSSLIAGLLLACLIGALYGAYHCLRMILNAGNVAYGLTDRRLIIAIGGWRSQSFGARAFRSIHRSLWQRGTLWFGWSDRSYTHRYRHALFGVTDVEFVEHLLRQQFTDKKKRNRFWRLQG